MVVHRGKKNVQWASPAAKASTAKAKLRLRQKAARSAPEIKPQVPFVPYNENLHVVYAPLFAEGVLFVLAHDVQVMNLEGFAPQACKTLSIAASSTRWANIVPNSGHTFMRGTPVLYVGTAHETERLVREPGIVEALKHKFLIGSTVYYLNDLGLIKPLCQ